jgi:hypothetical protein
MDLEIKPVDRPIYDQQLASFLPSRMIDMHSHGWRKNFR